MNSGLFEQAEQLFKPVTEIMALNARTFEALAEKQTGLMSGMWSEGLNCAKDMSGRQDMQSIYAVQREFWESMSQKMSATARDSYNVLTEAQEEMGKLVQNSFTSVDFSSMGVSSAASPFQQAGQETAQAATEQAADATQSTASATQEATKKSAEAAETTAKSTAKASAKSSDKVAGGAKGAGGKSGNKANG